MVVKEGGTQKHKWGGPASVAARPGIAVAVLKFVEDSHQSRFFNNVFGNQKFCNGKNKGLAILYVKRYVNDLHRVLSRRCIFLMFCFHHKCFFFRASGEAVYCKTAVISLFGEKSI